MKSGIFSTSVAYPLAGGILSVWLGGCSPQVATPQASSAPESAPSPAATPSTVSSEPSSGTSLRPLASETEAAGEATGQRSTRARVQNEPEAKEETPVFFEGRERVTYAEFIDELRKIADALADDPDVRAAHEQLLTEKGLSPNELPLQSFSRARLAFESARDSGLWGIRGTVTDQMPWSDRVWEQWATRSFTPEGPLPSEESRAFPTAEAECDELGALFCILARDLGVIGFVGLHWPYWNHVVPVWQINKEDGTFVRIVVPATQTFLDKRDTIGTTGLKTNRIVFPYVRKDRKPETEMSADLARYLLTQSQLHGGKSTQQLTDKRLWHRWNHRPGAPEPEAQKTVKTDL